MACCSCFHEGFSEEIDRNFDEWRNRPLTKDVPFHKKTLTEADKNSSSYKAFLKEIQKCKENKNPALTLSGYNFPDLPPELFELEHLQSLNLYASSLVRISPEIKKLKNLKTFIPYTSYSLHYFPYEVTYLPLTETTVSTRAIYGNYKNHAPFPQLPPFPKAPMSLKEMTARKLKLLEQQDRKQYEIQIKPKLNQDMLDYLNTAKFCSVCSSPYFEICYEVWVSRVMGTDLVPMYCLLCSMACVEKTSIGCKKSWHQGGPNYVQDPLF